MTAPTAPRRGWRPAAQAAPYPGRSHRRGRCTTKKTGCRRSVGVPGEGVTDRAPQADGSARRVKRMAGRNDPHGTNRDIRDDVRAQIREFLGTRRARVTPEQAGLPIYGGE